MAGDALVSPPKGIDADHPLHPVRLDLTMRLATSLGVLEGIEPLVPAPAPDEDIGRGADRQVGKIGPDVREHRHGVEPPLRRHARPRQARDPLAPPRMQWRIGFVDTLAERITALGGVVTTVHVRIISARRPTRSTWSAGWEFRRRSSGASWRSGCCR